MYRVLPEASKLNRCERDPPPSVAECRSRNSVEVAPRVVKAAVAARWKPTECALSSGRMYTETQGLTKLFGSTKIAVRPTARAVLELESGMQVRCMGYRSLPKQYLTPKIRHDGRCDGDRRSARFQHRQPRWPSQQVHSDDAAGETRCNKRNSDWA